VIIAVRPRAGHSSKSEPNKILGFLDFSVVCVTRRVQFFRPWLSAEIRRFRCLDVKAGAEILSASLLPDVLGRLALG
jgi:hypothetical protein